LHYQKDSSLTYVIIKYIINVYKD